MQRNNKMGLRGHGILSLFSMAILALASISNSLEVGFYKHSCPSAEAIVRQTVINALAGDPGLAAGLIRMHFHDCFVRGCDASVLLDSTPGNKAEKDSPINNPSLRGFDVIDAAKAAVEAHCPCTVSCADILAFAARDSSFISGNIDYPVPAGRRDGRVSVEAETIDNLPSPAFTAELLAANFARKGLTLDEMVTLSGAHSLGRAHCSSLNLTPSTGTTMLDPDFANFLKAKCPPATANFGDPTTVDLDVVSPNKLDNKYYWNLVKGRGVLGSDQTLWTSPATAGLVAADVRDGDAWAAKFAAAMVKMGSIESGWEGEVRERCRVVNNKSSIE